MGGSAASNWDEVWAEFDAREPARVAAPPRLRASRRARPARGLRRPLLFIGLALAGLYLLSPLACALQLGAAIQRGDAESLARQVDWDSLRPALAGSLAARTREAESMPGFIGGMTRDMAARLAEPEALTELLNARLASGGPAREMLGRVRILQPGLWEIELAPPGPSGRAARLTLALADPWRLRWELRAIALPSGAAGRL